MSLQTNETEPAAARIRNFSVYVIELNPAASANAGLGCVYVGETALTPEERWERHSGGARTASRIVTRFGRHLRPDLTSGLGPFATRAQAEQAEADLAAELRRRGYVVFGGQGRTFGVHSMEPPTRRTKTRQRDRFPQCAGQAAAHVAPVGTKGGTT